MSLNQMRDAIDVKLFKMNGLALTFILFGCAIFEIFGSAILDLSKIYRLYHYLLWSNATCQ